MKLKLWDEYIRLNPVKKKKKKKSKIVKVEPHKY